MLRGGQNWVITGGQFSVDIPSYPQLLSVIFTFHRNAVVESR